MPQLTACGGFDAKCPACFLLEIEGRRLLLDLVPDRTRLDGIGRIDVVLISHGHADHVGSLDLLGQVGAPPVHATAPVRALATDPVLAGARDLHWRGEIAGLPVETGHAGHAPDSVWMRIGGAKGLVYTGDMAEGSALFPADHMPRAAAMVLDASYGLSAKDRGAQRAALLTAIGAGPCLLPAPADERGLELALMCLDAGHEVAMCGDTRRTAQILLAHPEWLVPGAAEHLTRLLARTAELNEASPLVRVMIAAGANCGSGVSQHLGPRAIAAGVPVIPTGHLSDGSPGAAWVREGWARRLVWNVHPTRAGLAAALDQVLPAVALAAFAPPPERRAIAAAFPGRAGARMA